MAASSDLLLQSEALSKTYHWGKPNAFTAFADIHLSIEAQTCTLLQGASGSGKTSLIAVLSCLDKPTAGRLHILGEMVSRLPEKFLTLFRRQHIGVVFQHFQLVEDLPVAQNIAIPLLPWGLSSRLIASKVAEIAHQVGIDHKLEVKAGFLSGGEKQRVAIARALVNNPTLIFADEPTAHLDQANATQILQVFQDLKHAGKTLLISTHDPWVMQHPLVDNKIRLQDGRMVTASQI